MRELVSFVQAELKAMADVEKARAMAAYMKTDMPFYGVQAGPRRKLLTRINRRFKPGDEAELRRLVGALWELPHREEKYLAIGLAVKNKAQIGPSCLDLYECLIRQGAWWDFVDEVAAHLLGGAILKSPQETWPVMDEWINDPDMWIRRSALICQLRLKENTDEKRLFAYCSKRAFETEFFIRKAIGWALRQYSYTEPQAVIGFLKQCGDKLSGLSRREAEKGLKRNGLI